MTAYVYCIHVCIHDCSIYMYMCCFALFVCLTLLASFFLPSHLSFKNMYILVFSEYRVYGRDSIKSVFSITGQYSQSMQCMEIHVASSVFSITGQYSLPQVSILRECSVWWRVEVSILYHKSVFSTTGQYSLSQVSIHYHSSVFSEYAEYGDSIRSVFSITD